LYDYNKYRFLKVHYMAITLVKNSLLQNPHYKGSAQSEYSASSQGILRIYKGGCKFSFMTGAHCHYLIA